MKILLTGADGFLGWHLRARLRATTDHQVIAVGRADMPQLAGRLDDVECVIHLAGVNRGDDAAVERGNADAAAAVGEAVRTSGRAPRIIFANSIQAGADSPYGRGKAAASELLAAAAATAGSAYVDVLLPNLFGEHGRPHYNSFVATFVEAVLTGRTPEIADRPVELLHVQAAAQSLIEAISSTDSRCEPAGTPTTVRTVLDTLVRFNELYTVGDIPDLHDDLDVNLFNTLRSARFPEGSPIPLTPRSDDRGRLVEVVRAHGGEGQTFVSTTRPGITRGEHFHLHKIERFVVVAGRARISLRRLLTTEVVTFDVDGGTPVAVDMPTLWVHNITNVGSSELVTVFWANELFDPAAPDTIAEPVVQSGLAG